MRTKNTIKNMKYSVISQVLNLIVKFINRTVFIKILGSEYLGVNGLFTNILTILSLVDLGIGNVLIYSMYKPLAEDDRNKIRLLLKEYKKIYNIIAVIVLILGLLMTPFIEQLINGETTIKNLKIIFLLYLADTVVSYLCVYKISIINADQKNYIVTFIQQVFNIISNAIMLVMLAITRKFIVYLAIKIAFSVICNIYLSKKATKMYPYIKESCAERLPSTEKKQIFKDTRAMLFHKIGGVVVSGTDSILMSAMINLNTVGIYSNYLLISNAIRSFANLFFSAMSSSIGNLNVKKSKEYTYNIFKKVFYGNFFIYTFATICMICLINPFIEMWVGEEYLFGMEIVLAFCISFYIEGMRQTVIVFRNGLGLFQQDQFKPALEAIVNLVLSIILALRYGIIGIILGTICSMLFVSVGVESFVLYKHGFEQKWINYLKMYMKYLCIGIISLLVVYFINTLIVGTTFLYLAIRFLVTIFITALLLVFFTYRTEEFHFMLDIFKNKKLR